MKATGGQLAFEAYRDHQRGLAHDNSPIPTWDSVPDANKIAWESFARAARTGAPLSRAYNEDYLSEVAGKSVSGDPAPSWAWLIANRRDIAEAWQASWLAVQK